MRMMVVPRREMQHVQQSKIQLAGPANVRARLQGAHEELGRGDSCSAV